MKTTRFFAALAAVLFISCSKNTPESPVIPEEAAFLGTVTVIWQDAPFDNENILVDFTPSDDGTRASLTLHQIRFVPQMPVTLDVTVPDITVESTTEKVILSCKTCIPLAMGGEYPRYTVTDLQGELVGQELSFSLHFGDYPTAFKGTRK